MNNERRMLGPAVALASVLLLSGCVVAPARYNYAGEVVAVTPPTAVVETVGIAPFAGALWFGGYWNWAGGRHVWAPGYWGAPRAGYRWVPHEWVRAGGGWRLNQGHWSAARR